MREREEEKTKYFAPFSDYATHIEAHGSEIKCDLCDYTTKLRRNLNKHLWQMHTKREKIHQCDQCHQNFILPYQLKDHKEKIHEGIVRKLHSCDQCEKKFRYPYEVKIHVEKVHLGKDFSTSGQNTQNNNLVLHPNLNGFVLDWQH